MGHVEQVLLEAEPPVAGVLEERHAGLPVPATVGPLAGQHLVPHRHHLVALDGGEADREPPVLQAAHALHEERADLVDALDAPPRRVDVHGVVGEERREVEPGGRRRPRSGGGPRRRRRRRREPQRGGAASPDGGMRRPRQCHAVTQSV